MGKVLSAYDASIPSDLLSHQILPTAAILTGCRDYAGSLVEIRRIYERFRRSRHHSGYHLSLSLFQLITHNSPVEGLSDAYSTFSHHSSKTVNVLEFISALVLTSCTSWQNKVMFLMRLFDFDNNKCLTRDEITILCVSVLNGFCCLVGRQRVRSATLAQVSTFVFDTADMNPDGLITYDEYALYRLMLWTQSQGDLIELMQQFALQENAEEPDLVFLYMHEVHTQNTARLPLNTERTKTLELSPQRRNQTFDGRITHRPKADRKSPNLPHVRGATSCPRAESLLIRTKRVTKDDVVNLKKAFDRMDKAGTGRLTVNEFQEEFAKTPALKAVANSIFSSYDTKSTGTITFEEMLVKSFRGASRSDVSTMLKWVRGTLYPDWEHERYMRSPPLSEGRNPARKVTINTAVEYKKLFDLYDKNKDGELDLAELKAGLGSVFPAQEIEAMVKEYDSDHDNKISLVDFMKLMSPPNATVSPEILQSVAPTGNCTRS